MKYWLKTVAGILVLTAGSVNWVEAADYENPANDTQVQIRSQSRQMQSMSSQERTLYRDLNEPASKGKGKGKGNTGGQKQRYGQGNSNGSGSTHRYGQGNDQAYGSGYGSRQGGGGNGGGGRGR